MRSGVTEQIPYSLSRWTDVPADPGKWAWFKAQVAKGSMVAIDPRNAIPYHWSLRPEDTLGLVFWRKDPTNLLFDAPWLKNYRFKVHVTVTGWEEVEKGAPSLRNGANLLAMAAAQFGPENVTWRFSPVPMVPDVVQRFGTILAMASEHGVRSVYVSFLQTNDLMPETRDDQERLNVLVQMAEAAQHRGVQVYLCNEDRLLAGHPGIHPALGAGICAPPEDFALAGRDLPPSEGCGCVLMADPFTINESCTIGCKYCYAAAKEFAPKKMNTNRSLPVLR